MSKLNGGGVIAYPTEAVWGLGCDPFNRHGVERIFELKGRSANKGLIMVAASIEQIDWLLEGLPQSQIEQLTASWPGHVTWLIPHRNLLPGNLTGSHASIAVRVSAHPVVKALCAAFGGPIVSTSANPQGKLPARNSTMARRYFGRSGVEFGPGQVGVNRAPSQIRDLVTGAILRD